MLSNQLLRIGHTRVLSFLGLLRISGGYLAFEAFETFETSADYHPLQPTRYVRNPRIPGFLGFLGLYISAGSRNVTCQSPSR